MTSFAATYHRKSAPTEPLSIYNPTDTQKALNRGFTWAVVAQYQHAGHARGEIISLHRSYDAANRKACSGSLASFRGIVDLHYAN